MGMLQLNPPIPVHVLGKGDGYAYVVIDYSQEHNIHYICGIDSTGELWTMPNREVRLQKNISLNRLLTFPNYKPKLANPTTPEEIANASLKV